MRFSDNVILSVAIRILVSEWPSPNFHSRSPTFMQNISANVKKKTTDTLESCLWQSEYITWKLWRCYHLLHVKQFDEKRSTKMSNSGCFGKIWNASIPIYIQQDATLHGLFISGHCSTRFGWYLHPSSGARTTVPTASGICQTVTATCRYRGR